MIVFIHGVCNLAGNMICFFRNRFINNDCVCVLVDFNRVFSMKRIEKVKNRLKSELEVTIKVSDSKNVEIVSVMKEMESAVRNINIKQQKFQQVLFKQKRLFEIWFFLTVEKTI